MYENKMTTAQGIHYTRYIISWLDVGGRSYDFSGEKFVEWLRENKLTDDEIEAVIEIAMTGKLELEITAEPYVKAQRKIYEEYEKEDFINSDECLNWQTNGIGYPTYF